jgi:hypothetical protein
MYRRDSSHDGPCILQIILSNLVSLDSCSKSPKSAFLRGGGAAARYETEHATQSDMD